eukprot:jgi/Chrzof1/4636/Cz14g20240.t1
MTDIKVADWTPHIRGFWTLSLLELFSRPHSDSGKPPTLLQKLRKNVSFIHGQPLHWCMQAHTAVYLLFTAGTDNLKMAIRKRAAQKPIDSGAMQYTVIVATKP